MIKFPAFLCISMMSFSTAIAQHHALSDEEKEDYLYTIWHKDVRHFYFGDSLTGQLVLTLVVPDSQVKSISRDTIGFAFGYAAVYNAFILRPHKIKPDSATVVMYKYSDTINPFYTAVVHLNLIRYNEQSAVAMTEALMYLCPGAKYHYVAGDELCEVFDAPKQIDSNYLMKYASIVTGITAKYIWKNSQRIQRIVFVWLGPNGMPYPITFSIKSKEYEKAMKFL